ncbi:MAG: hypothetical protein KME03_08910 [Aphanocapsa lilacina HA4352-LM1]|jgi:hypothetical protein|nr:hypothetical protein [Aphanocapsa lilacina HA4352-LM1]
MKNSNDFGVANTRVIVQAVAIDVAFTNAYRSFPRTALGLMLAVGCALSKPLPVTYWAMDHQLGDIDALVAQVPMPS